MSEIERCIDTSFASRIEEVGNEGKGITIFFGDFVKSSIIDTETERAVLFTDKEYRGSMRGTSLTDETNA